MGGSDHFYFFLDVATTVDVLRARNTDITFVETQTAHFA